MTYDSLVTNLQTLGLFITADVIQQHFTDPKAQDDNFLQVMDAALLTELSERNDKRSVSLLRRAKLLHSPAQLDELLYLPERCLDQQLIARLKTGRYIQDHRNVCIFGASGTGKSFMGKSLGVQACSLGYRTLYVRFPSLMRELLYLELHDSKQYEKRIRFYSRISVLLIDEWLLSAKKHGYAQILLDLMDSRYGETSTIFCTQLDPEGWSAAVDLKAVGQSILGRAMSNSFTIHMKGDDLRKNFNIKP